ncbi:MAG: serine hydrolase domain-containing protein [Pseudomonadota bacterium]
MNLLKRKTQELHARLKITVFLFLILASLSVIAQANRLEDAPDSQRALSDALKNQPSILNILKLEQWADDYFTKAMDQGIINGAAFGMVQNGEVIILRGYGYQDLANRIAFDPYKSKVRLCSTTKSMNAVALLQQIERGQIESIDTPISRYLKRWKIPNDVANKITLRNLMTHSSGMAGHYSPQGTKIDIPVPLSAADVESFFTENFELPPNTISQYANLGVALQSVLLEDVTGQVFSDYIKENILQPLQMEDALIHHDLSIPENLVQPYGRFPNGELQAIPFYPKHPLTAASGGLIATPADMLKYISFLADTSSRKYVDILSNELKIKMQTRQYQNHSGDSGSGLHLFPQKYTGVDVGSTRIKVVSHGCGLPGTQSYMLMLPEFNLGFLFSVIRGSASPSFGDVLGSFFDVGRLAAKNDKESKDKEVKLPGYFTSFTDTFLGERIHPIVTPNNKRNDAIGEIARIVGTYWTERRSMGAITALFAAVRTTEVTYNQETEILSVGRREYTQIAAGVFDEIDGDRRVIFRKPASMDNIFMHTSPASSFRKVEGFQNPNIAFALLLTSLGIMFLGAFAVFTKPESSITHRAKILSVTNGLLVISIPFVLFAGYESMAAIGYIDWANGDTSRAVVLAAVLNAIMLVGILFIINTIKMLFERFESHRNHSNKNRTISTRALISCILMSVVIGLSFPAYFLFNIVGLRML